MVPYRGPVKRWDLFWAYLDPVVGSEQGGGRRPVLVVSNNGFNNAYDVVTIISLTRYEGKRRKVYPFEVLLPVQLAGNPHASIIMPQQIRTISKLRLLGYIGTLEDPAKQAEIENRMLEHLDLEFEAELMP